MKTRPSGTPGAQRLAFDRSMVCGIALVSFAAGSFLTAQAVRANQVSAESHRVFELLIYHTVPGKVPALEAIFRDVAKLQAKYHLHAVGYWVPDEDPAWANTFVYVVAHPSRAGAEANWRALHADPEFLPYRQSAEPLLEKVKGGYNVDEIYMRPSDFSAMR